MEEAATDTLLQNDAPMECSLNLGMDLIKVKRKRSSILKPPRSSHLFVEDVADNDRQEEKRRYSRSSKRVSFAETFQIQEFLRDSKEDSVENADSVTTDLTPAEVLRPADVEYRGPDRKRCSDELEVDKLIESVDNVPIPVAALIPAEVISVPNVVTSVKTDKSSVPNSLKRSSSHNDSQPQKKIAIIEEDASQEEKQEIAAKPHPNSNPVANSVAIVKYDLARPPSIGSENNVAYYKCDDVPDTLATNAHDKKSENVLHNDGSSDARAGLPFSLTFHPSNFYSKKRKLESGTSNKENLPSVTQQNKEKQQQTNLEPSLTQTVKIVPREVKPKFKPSKKSVHGASQHKHQSNKSSTAAKILQTKATRRTDTTNLNHEGDENSYVPNMVQQVYASTSGYLHSVDSHDSVKIPTAFYGKVELGVCSASTFDQAEKSLNSAVPVQSNMSASMQGQNLSSHDSIQDISNNVLRIEANKQGYISESSFAYNSFVESRNLTKNILLVGELPEAEIINVPSAGAPVLHSVNDSPNKGFSCDYTQMGEKLDFGSTNKSAGYTFNSDGAKKNSYASSSCKVSKHSTDNSVQMNATESCLPHPAVSKKGSVVKNIFQDLEDELAAARSVHTQASCLNTGSSSIESRVKRAYGPLDSDLRQDFQNSATCSHLQELPKTSSDSHISCVKFPKSKNAMNPFKDLEEQLAKENASSSNRPINSLNNASICTGGRMTESSGVLHPGRRLTENSKSNENQNSCGNSHLFGLQETSSYSHLLHIECLKSQNLIKNPFQDLEDQLAKETAANSSDVQLSSLKNFEVCAGTGSAKRTEKIKTRENHSSSSLHLLEHHKTSSESYLSGEKFGDFQHLAEKNENSIKTSKNSHKNDGIDAQVAKSVGKVDTKENYVGSTGNSEIQNSFSNSPLLELQKPPSCSYLSHVEFLKSQNMIKNPFEDLEEELAKETLSSTYMSTNHHKNFGDIEAEVRTSESSSEKSPSENTKKHEVQSASSSSHLSSHHTSQAGKSGSVSYAEDKNSTLHIYAKNGNTTIFPSGDMELTCVEEGDLVSEISTSEECSEILNTSEKTRMFASAHMDITCIDRINGEDELGSPKINFPPAINNPVPQACLEAAGNVAKVHCNEQEIVRTQYFVGDDIDGISLSVSTTDLCDQTATEGLYSVEKPFNKTKFFGIQMENRSALLSENNNVNADVTNNTMGNVTDHHNVAKSSEKHQSCVTNTDKTQIFASVDMEMTCVNQNFSLSEDTGDIFSHDGNHNAMGKECIQYNENGNDKTKVFATVHSFLDEGRSQAGTENEREVAYNSLPDASLIGQNTIKGTFQHCEESSEKETRASDVTKNKYLQNDVTGMDERKLEGDSMLDNMKSHSGLIEGSKRDDEKTQYFTTKDMDMTCMSVDRCNVREYGNTLSNCAQSLHSDEQACEEKLFLATEANEKTCIFASADMEMTCIISSYKVSKDTDDISYGGNEDGVGNGVKSSYLSEEGNEKTEKLTSGDVKLTCGKCDSHFPGDTVKRFSGIKHLSVIDEHVEQKSCDGLKMIAESIDGGDDCTAEKENEKTQHFSMTDMDITCAGNVDNSEAGSFDFMNENTDCDDVIKVSEVGESCVLKGSKEANTLALANADIVSSCDDSSSYKEKECIESIYLIEDGNGKIKSFSESVCKYKDADTSNIARSSNACIVSKMIEGEVTQYFGTVDMDMTCADVKMIGIDSENEENISDRLAVENICCDRQVSNETSADLQDAQEVNVNNNCVSNSADLSDNIDDCDVLLLHSEKPSEKTNFVLADMMEIRCVKENNGLVCDDNIDGGKTTEDTYLPKETNEKTEVFTSEDMELTCVNHYAGDIMYLLCDKDSSVAVSECANEMVQDFIPVATADGVLEKDFEGKRSENTKDCVDNLCRNASENERNCNFVMTCANRSDLSEDIKDIDQGSTSDDGNLGKRCCKSTLADEEENGKTKLFTMEHMELTCINHDLEDTRQLFSDTEDSDSVNECAARAVRDFISVDSVSNCTEGADNNPVKGNDVSDSRRKDMGRVEDSAGGDYCDEIMCEKTKFFVVGEMNLTCIERNSLELGNQSEFGDGVLRELSAKDMKTDNQATNTAQIFGSQDMSPSAVHEVHDHSGTFDNCTAHCNMPEVAAPSENAHILASVAMELTCINENGISPKGIDCGYNCGDRCSYVGEEPTRDICINKEPNEKTKIFMSEEMEFTCVDHCNHASENTLNPFSADVYSDALNEHACKKTGDFPSVDVVIPCTETADKEGTHSGIGIKLYNDVDELKAGSDGMNFESLSQNSVSKDTLNEELNNAGSQNYSSGVSVTPTAVIIRFSPAVVELSNLQDNRDENRCMGSISPRMRGSIISQPDVDQQMDCDPQSIESKNLIDTHCSENISSSAAQKTETRCQNKSQDLAKTGKCRKLPNHPDFDVLYQVRRAKKKLQMECDKKEVSKRLKDDNSSKTSATESVPEESSSTISEKNCLGIHDVPCSSDSTLGAKLIPSGQAFVPQVNYSVISEKSGVIEDRVNERAAHKDEPNDHSKICDLQNDKSPNKISPEIQSLVHGERDNCTDGISYLQSDASAEKDFTDCPKERPDHVVASHGNDHVSYISGEPGCSVGVINEVASSESSQQKQLSASLYDNSVSDAATELPNNDPVLSTSRATSSHMESLLVPEINKETSVASQDLISQAKSPLILEHDSDVGIDTKLPDASSVQRKCQFVEGSNESVVEEPKNECTANVKSVDFNQAPSNGVSSTFLCSGSQNVVTTNFEGDLDGMKKSASSQCSQSLNELSTDVEENNKTDISISASSFYKKKNAISKAEFLSGDQLSDKNFFGSFQETKAVGFEKDDTASEVQPCAAFSKVLCSVTSDEVLPSPVCREIVPCTTSDVLHPAASAEVIPSAVCREVVLCTTSDVLHPAASAEVIPSAVCREVVLCTTSDVLHPATSAEVLPRATSAEVLPSATSAEVPPPASSVEVLPPATTVKVLPPTTSAEALSSAASAAEALSNASSVAEALSNASSVAEALSSAEVLPADPGVCDVNCNSAFPQIPSKYLDLEVSSSLPLVQALPSSCEDANPAAVSSKFEISEVIQRQSEICHRSNRSDLLPQCPDIGEESLPFVELPSISEATEIENSKKEQRNCPLSPLIHHLKSASSAKKTISDVQLHDLSSDSDDDGIDMRSLHERMQMRKSTNCSSVNTTQSCGLETSKLASNITSGDVDMVPCQNPQQSKFVNHTSEKYEHLFSDSSDSEDLDHSKHVAEVKKTTAERIIEGSHDILQTRSQTYKKHAKEAAIEVQEQSIYQITIMDILEPVIKATKQDKCLWEINSLQEDKVIFTFIWDTLLVSITFDEDPDSQYVKKLSSVTLESKFRPTTTDVGKLSHVLFFNLLGKVTLEEKYPDTTFILQLLEHLSVPAKRAMMLVIDAEHISVSHKFYLQNDTELCVEVASLAARSINRLRFPIDIATYPYAKILPVVDHLRGRDHSEMMLKAMCAEEPAIRYIWRMVHAVDNYFYSLRS